MKLTGDERRHLADVLRSRVGDRVIICPNDGKDYIYEITAFDKTAVTLDFVECVPNPTEPDLFLCAYIALLKGDKTELEVQKLTELGARRIVPFTSDRTVKGSEKSERLRRAAHEASGDVINGTEKRVALVIGPEGGFSEEEVNAAEKAGYEGVTLGKRILRAETAAIAGAAVIMQLCGEWK